MYKKYSIIITEEDEKVNIKRENDGFNAFELLGYIELCRSEMVIQIRSMDNSKINVERIAHSEDGDKKIIINENNKEH